MTERRSTRWMAAAAMAASCASSCFSPEWEQCRRCTDRCPGGQTCRGGFCVDAAAQTQCNPDEHADGSDTSPPEDPTSDAPTSDAPTSDAPTISQEGTGGGTAPDNIPLVGTGGAGGTSGERTGGAGGAGGSDGLGATGGTESLAVLPAVLPAPCSGSEYRVELVASGAPPHRWSVDTNSAAAQDALAITPDPVDSNRAVLSGVVRQSTTLTVRVTNDSGAASLSTVLEPRSSCWLGYLANRTGNFRVHLYDTLLEVEAQPLPVDLPAGDRVLDFEFSPDGHWLALRVAGPDTAAHLELYAFPELKRHASHFAGPVTFYTWAPDSTALAVVFDSTTGVVLSGLDIPARSALPNDTPLATWVPVSAPVEARPLWIHSAGSELPYVVFAGSLQDALPEFPIAVVQRAARSLDGFSAPEEPLGYYSGEPNTVEIRAHAAGFLAWSPASPFGIDHFFPRPGLDPFDAYASHGPAELPPTAGAHLVERSALGEVVFYAAESDSFLDGPVARTEPDVCGRLLSISRTGQRVACVTGAAPGAALRIVEFDPEHLEISTHEVRSTFDDSGDVYSEAAAFQRRRLFSPDGKWFVFSADHSLFAADLSTQPFIQPHWLRLLLDVAPELELVFSPDGQKVARHQGDGLSVQSFPVSDQFYGIAQIQTAFRMPPPARCSEEFVSAPAQWCGGTQRGSRFIWSPDSRTIVYETVDGGLALLTPGVGSRTITGDCGAGCVGSYAFQP